MEKSQQEQRTPHMPYSLKRRPKKRDRNEQRNSSNQERTTTTNGATEASSRNIKPPPQEPLSALSPCTLGVCPLISSRYIKVGGRVGEGTYGVVYQALDKVTNRKVALKRCIPHHESSDGFPLTTLREVHTLKVCCQHPNIVDLLEIAVNDNTSLDSKGNPRGGVFLVFEYCPTDLANILDTYAAEQQNHKKRNKSHRGSRHQQYSPFSEAQVKTLTQQLLRAIDCCHSHFFIHRDIKPSNLLYTSDGVLKLCDFGLSRHCSARVDQPPLTPNVVSLWYRAPELLFKKVRGNTSTSSYSFPIDLFAVGCVFCEFLQGYPLLDGKTELEQMDKMVECLGEPPTRLYDRYKPSQVSWSSSSKSTTAALWDRFEYLSTEGLSLMTRLLEYDPGERWTASQALQSEYFATSPLPTTTMPSLRELGVG